SGQESRKVEAELSQAVKRMGGKQGCTLLMTLLSAYHVLLHRLSGETDIVVGIPTAGRGLEGSEDLMGYCVHLLPIRNQLQADLPFADFLKSMRGTLLDAYENADYPFAHLLNKLDLNRDFSRSALVSAAFNLDLPMELPAMGNLEAIPLPPPKIPAPYDIYITATEVDGALQLDCSYNQDVLDGSTIQRWLAHFETLLGAIATDPSQPIGTLPLLTESEQQQTLQRSMGEVRELSDRCLHHLIEQQVSQIPDTTAVVFDGQSLTYTQLNQRANQLAHHLQELGVKAETLVGLCLERSLDMVVAVLAVMKTGAAYVPLDPSYPMERIAFMVEDAKVAVLLTQPAVQTSLSGDLAKLTPAPVISLDPDWSQFASQSTENLDSTVEPSNLAYVIYTSGSTGQPKGVAIAHRAIVNYVQSMVDQLELEPGSRFAYVSTISADLGNTMFFPALCTGGTLHVLPWNVAADALSFGRYIQDQQIDYLKIVPSHLAALQDPNNPHQVLPRKALVLGGEATPVSWVESLLAGNTSCTIYNHYGPTETTVGVLTYRVDPEQLPSTATLPLERPVHNTQIYLLDAQLNPVPTGAHGEIYIGGPSVAQGYLNRPDLTAERFIERAKNEIKSEIKSEERGTKNEKTDQKVDSNPENSSLLTPHSSLFITPPLDRLYKTGDLARYLPNGQIEFLGRADQQVKINGFRVELKDIEAKLSQHPDVRETAVVTRRSDTGEHQPFAPKQVVAYVVADGDRAPVANGLPRYKLPNNLAIAQLNKNETDYIYREIFELQAYRKHGITVQSGDCIVDVGGNIGLFSLFTAQTCPGLTIYAFEPNPTVFNILSTNLSLYGDRFNLKAKPFNCGLSAETGTAEFTFFPGFSLLSGFYADADTEREVVKNFVKNQGDGNGTGNGNGSSNGNGGTNSHNGNNSSYTVADGETAQAFLDEADSILAERFQAETFTAQLRTLSDMIAEEGIEHIDLLKINVEKSEWDVLSGVRTEDWAKIRQLVVEVDVEENLQPILDLLQKQGFDTLVDQDVLLTHTELCYVYAIRPSERGTLLRDQAPDAHRIPIPTVETSLLTAADLREFIRDRLPEHAWPTAYVFLESLPLTPNGKLDSRALPAPDQALKGESEYVKPDTDTEKVLAEIWQSVLGIDRVGLHDNFFEIGGNSLLLIQAHRAVQEQLQVTVPVVELFGYPTIKVLAEYLTKAGQPQQADIEKEKKREESRRQGRSKMTQRRKARQRNRK
ncbi:MAG: amino acid adenylation domain-containing protein, partial [Cyanothece sp. SIO2G6]|nr:amino acid adenylation domain-containing protein [Cyanothece sp. SIO2G6]